MIGFGQNVNIPDANFKAYLVGNSAINTNGDTEIQVSEATAFNGYIHCYGLSISDLTGIENFISLTGLFCGNNILTNLDLSNNIALSSVMCNDNQLTILNLKNGNNSSITGSNVINCLTLINNPLLYCIEVDNATFSNNNWSSAIDTQHYFSTNCSATSIQEHKTTKELLKVTDLLGRETKQTNQPLFYIYDDGIVEKRIVIE